MSYNIASCYRNTCRSSSSTTTTTTFNCNTFNVNVSSCSNSKALTNGGGEDVFESAEGTRLTFSLQLLAQLSTFFKSLLDLSLTPHPEGSQIYTLPSATHHGLAYTFELISSLAGGTPSPAFECAPWGDVLVIADAYDLPLVSNWITLKSVLYLDKDPFIPYTIASLTGDQSNADMAMRRSIGRDPLRMPEWANTLLKRNHPLALIGLYELHGKYQLAKDEFGRRLRARGEKDFEEICKLGEACSAYRASEGDFGELKAKCAEVVMDGFRRCEGGKGVDPSMIGGVTLAMTWCERCQRILEKEFVKDWRDTLGELINSTSASI